MKFLEGPFHLQIFGGEKMKCSLCNKTIIRVKSHNAFPINTGRCCGVCNDTKVLPARLIKAFGKDRLEAG